jgi:hypothetical protein
MGDLNDEHEAAEVRLGCSDLTGRPLRDVRLLEGAMVVLIRRDGDVIYPRGNPQLKIGDRPPRPLLRHPVRVIMTFVFVKGTRARGLRALCTVYARP